MTDAKLSCERLDLPLTRPLIMAGHRLTSRSVIRVTLVDSRGHTGCGDISPLPGLHHETCDQALAQVQAMCTGHCPEMLYPSVQLGVDMAQWAMAREQPCGAVKLNALVWGDTLEQVDALLDQGYECLKVKVGREALAMDIVRVQQIKQRVRGRACLRLDANRTWSLDEAVTFARAVGTEQVAYIEEPTARYEDQVTFFQDTGMPYAWDESLGDHMLHEADGLAALVIKPACVGSLEKVDELVTWAGTYDKEAVISSAFESSLALAFYARYCLWRGIENTCHGLDTWRWLEEGAECVVKRGCMVVGGRDQESGGWG
ncbi:MAG: o-succinylbenzoate synthase [Planctomycetes bacterium]|nr:o-succinylbenzoate synthase [Planctomycetota bacterium]